MSNSPVTGMVVTRHTSAMLLAGILLLTVIAYSNSFAGVWQFDDFPVIVNDVRVQSLSAWWQAMPAIRPLFKLSVAIDHVRGAQGGIAAFHFSNLLFHLINVVLVHALLQRLLRALPLPEYFPAKSLNRQAKENTGAALWLTTLATLCFALHPAQTEAVTYVSGRSVSLATLFMLAALLLMPGKNSSASFLRWLPAMFALIAAVAVRETALITPLLMGLLWQAERDPSAPASGRAQWRRQRAVLLVLLLTLPVLLLMLVLVFPLYQHLISFAFGRVDAATHVATQVQSLAGLLLTAVGIAPLNADPDLIIAPLFSVQSLLATGLLLTFAALVLRLARTWRLAAWAGLALLILCLPTHSLLLRLDALNDRQLYLLLPFLALLPGMLALSCWQRTAQGRNAPAHASAQVSVLRRSGSAFALLVLLILAMLWGTQTWQRNRVYASEQMFWQDVHEKSPHNARACNNLGVARADAGDRHGAEAAFRCALDNDPRYVQAAINLRLLQENAWPSRSR